ncbi:MAG: hypothetical protein GY804_05410 [Alphaproteobacteria bacterium]|nr:hypothetical protein [Alphaproteobacteria bacterium]
MSGQQKALNRFQGTVEIIRKNDMLLIAGNARGITISDVEDAKNIGIDGDLEHSDDITCQNLYVRGWIKETDVIASGIVKIGYFISRETNNIGDGPKITADHVILKDRVLDNSTVTGRKTAKIGNYVRRAKVIAPQVTIGKGLETKANIICEELNADCPMEKEQLLIKNQMVHA